jgi:hypothetical protein
MAVGIQNFPNIVPANADYLDGDIKDAPSGTPVNRSTNGDIQQFFAKLLRVAGITPNGLRDNETNGYQLFDALQVAGKRYDSYVARITATGGGAPTLTYLSENDLGGTIVWAKVGTGAYTGTLAGAFPASKVHIFNNVQTPAKTGSMDRNNDDTIAIFIFDAGGTVDDDFVADIDIRVYR